MRLLIVVSIVLGVSVMSAQSDPAAITRVLQDQVEAWNRGDVDGYMKGYWRSDSTCFVSGGTVTRGYDSVLVRYKRNYSSREKMGRLTFGDLDIGVFSATAAVVTGSWKLVRAKDSPGGRFTLVFEKKPEGWRIVYDHTSVAP